MLMVIAVSLSHISDLPMRLLPPLWSCLYCRAFVLRLHLRGLFCLLILFINSNTRNTKTEIRSRAFVINDTRDNSVLCRYFIREAGRRQVASRRPKCASHSQKHQHTVARLYRHVCSIHGGRNEVVALCALAQRPILCSAPPAAAVQATGRNGMVMSIVSTMASGEPENNNSASRFNQRFNSCHLTLVTSCITGSSFAAKRSKHPKGSCRIEAAPFSKIASNDLSSVLTEPKLSPVHAELVNILAKLMGK